MYYVKVHGETLNDLEIALEAKLNELQGRKTRTATVGGGSIKARVSLVEEATLTDEDIDEMEEVESPYTGTPSIVIDNEVDSEGIPWDSRIHSGGKKQKKDGSWKLRKGVDRSQIVQVKAELLNRVGNATVSTAPVYVAPAPVASTTPAFEAPVVTPQPAPSAPVVAPVAPTTPAIPQVQLGHTLQSFQQNFAYVLSNLISQGKLTQDYVNQLKAQWNLTEIWMASPEQQEACFNHFAAHGLIQRVG